MNNPTTRRFPRDLNSAFGPYASGPIEEPKRPMDWQDRLVIVGSVIAAVALTFVLGWGRV